MIQVKSENTTNLPDHLARLLQPTPSGAAKLIAAWDGLSMESQMMLLTALERTDFPGYLADRILVKALESENDYVRYLAVRKLYTSDTSTAIKKRIDDEKQAKVFDC